jgi:hypothetical protein
MLLRNLADFISSWSAGIAPAHAAAGESIMLADTEIGAGPHGTGRSTSGPARFRRDHLGRRRSGNRNAAPSDEVA